MRDVVVAIAGMILPAISLLCTPTYCSLLIKMLYYSIKYNRAQKQTYLVSVSGRDAIILRTKV